MRDKNITRAYIAKYLKKKFLLSEYLSREIVDEIFWMLKDNLLLGNRVEIRGFGVFEIVERKEKIGRNPKSPENNIVIPAKKIVKFTQSSRLNV